MVLVSVLLVGLCTEACSSFPLKTLLDSHSCHEHYSPCTLAKAVSSGLLMALCCTPGRAKKRFPQADQPTKWVKIVLHGGEYHILHRSRSIFYILDWEVSVGMQAKSPHRQPLPRINHLLAPLWVESDPGKGSAAVRAAATVTPGPCLLLENCLLHTRLLINLRFNASSLYFHILITLSYGTLSIIWRIMIFLCHPTKIAQR